MLSVLKEKQKVYKKDDFNRKNILSKAIYV